MADKSCEVKKKMWSEKSMCTLLIITSGYLTTLQHGDRGWIIRRT